MYLPVQVGNNVLLKFIQTMPYIIEPHIHKTAPHIHKTAQKPDPDTQYYFLQYFLCNPYECVGIY